MKPIFLMTIFLALTLPAYADWSDTGMHPALGPNFSPNQGAPVQHAVHMNPAIPVRVEPQHRVQSAPSPEHTQPVRRDQPVEHRQTVERHVYVAPTYFRHDADYYGHAGVIFPDSDVDTGFTVPDGFEAIVADGQPYYYNEGVFYQEIDDQLVAIPPVLGAVVGYIPEDYQIVMSDGTHYLFTGGVYYQRVDQGFEVVQPPVSDQE